MKKLTTVLVMASFCIVNYDIFLKPTHAKEIISKKIDVGPGFKQNPDGFFLKKINYSKTKYTGQDCKRTVTYYSPRKLRLYIASNTLPKGEYKIRFINTSSNGQEIRKFDEKKGRSKEFYMSEIGLVEGKNYVYFEIFNRKTEKVVRSGSFEFEGEITESIDSTPGSWQMYTTTKKSESGKIILEEHKKLTCPWGETVITQSVSQPSWGPKDTEIFGRKRLQILTPNIGLSLNCYLFRKGAKKGNKLPDIGIHGDLDSQCLEWPGQGRTKIHH